MRSESHLSLSLVITIASAGVSITGCVDPPDDAPDTAATDPDGHTVYRTIVRFSHDGSPESTVEAITTAQQQAELAARAALVEARTSGKIHAEALPSLGIDSGCAGASLWLFDQANLAGNELCLFKAAADDAAWLDLGSLCATPNCWANAVRSLWAGADPGALQSCTRTLCYATPFLNFGAYQRINSVAPGSPHPLNWAYLFTP